MKKVDYAKLSEQYANFLVAAGGISITVLAVVLGFSGAPKSPSAYADALKEIQDTARAFLVAALITATVCCFIGAHMMAETAAFFTLNENTQREENKTPLGQRLFVLATSNIFISITLILFSIVLLPTATGIELAARLRWISVSVFLGVVVGALLWMVLSAVERMEVHKEGWGAIALATVAGFLTLILCYLSTRLWLKLTFIFIVICAALSLLYFGVLFRFGGACSRKSAAKEMAVFSSAITISYAFLVVACFRILWSY